MSEVCIEESWPAYVTLSRRDLRSTAALTQWRNLLQTLPEGIGVLVFSGGGVKFDPWVVAQYLLENCPRLRVMIAVNPVHRHPAAVADQLRSLVSLYGHRIDINYVAGGSQKDLARFGDSLELSMRWERIVEFDRAVLECLFGRPGRFSGNYFDFNLGAASRVLGVPSEMRRFVSGSSTNAQWAAQRMNVGRLEIGLRRRVAGAQGFNFGMIIRKSLEGAENALAQRYGDVQAAFDASRYYAPGKVLRLYSIRPPMSDAPIAVGNTESAYELLRELCRERVTAIMQLSLAPDDYRFLSDT